MKWLVSGELFDVYSHAWDYALWMLWTERRVVVKVAR